MKSPNVAFNCTGSYAVEVGGAGRTREVRQMVQGLHAKGLRVVLDVVYNHTFNSGVEMLRPRSFATPQAAGLQRNMEARRWCGASTQRGSG